jgi:hypothetical protein
MTTSFPDFQAAPNQGARPDLYELENQALDPDGVVLAAMRELAPWAGDEPLAVPVQGGLRSGAAAGVPRRRGRPLARGSSRRDWAQHGYVLFTIR